MKKVSRLEESRPAGVLDHDRKKEISGWSRPDWREEAACRGLESSLFFPDLKPKNERKTIAEAAKKICNVCEVQQQCHDHATENEDYGIWGGIGYRKPIGGKRKQF